jgi:glycerol kinase
MRGDAVSLGIIGDQQAATFGQRTGYLKNVVYGSG